MTNLKKMITGAAVALMIGGTMASTPASAGSGGAIAGAAIGGLIVGGVIGSAMSQPDYGYGYYPPPPPPRPYYGYGYRGGYYDYDD